MAEKVVYYISGIGADERAFKYLKINCSKIKNIHWIQYDGFESIKDYAKALSSQIEEDCDKEIFLIGVSFGGIIAQEIAKIIKCKKVFIISSVKSAKELSSRFKFLQKNNFLKSIPGTLFRIINRVIAKYAFGVRTPHEKRLLHEIIKDTDERFIKWAIEKIAQWDNNELLENVIHIHGVDDKIFPIGHIKNVKKIQGGHFVIVNKAKEISRIINGYLQERGKLPVAALD